VDDVIRRACRTVAPVPTTPLFSAVVGDVAKTRRRIISAPRLSGIFQIPRVILSRIQFNNQEFKKEVEDCPAI
jgi:hypothetical protein